jgi:hypothetical protein
MIYTAYQRGTRYRRGIVCYSRASEEELVRDGAAVCSHFAFLEHSHISIFSVEE